MSTGPQLARGDLAPLGRRQSCEAHHTGLLEERTGIKQRRRFAAAGLRQLRERQTLSAMTSLPVTGNFLGSFSTAFFFLLFSFYSLNFNAVALIVLLSTISRLSNRYWIGGEPLIPLHANHADLAQPERTHETDKDHAAKHDPEGDPVALHQGVRGGLVGEGGVVAGHGRGDDLGHAQADGGAELGARVEDGAAQGLHVLGIDVRDDEQADGEEDVAADGSEDLGKENWYE